MRLIEITLVCRIDDPSDWVAPDTAASYVRNLVSAHSRPLRVVRAKGREMISGAEADWTPTDKNG